MTIDQLMARLASQWAGQQVDKVEASGSDWAGSTEDGFHSTFDVYLVGPEMYRYLEGEELADFWNFVMRQEVKP